MAPNPLEWSVDEVGIWAETSGFATYKPCFVDNFINGRKLQTVDAAALAALGCRDFQDLKKIAKAIRDLFGIEAGKFSDSVADHRWTPQRVEHGCKVGYGQPVK